MRSSALFIALGFLLRCTAQEETVDSMPEDDEDSIVSAIFSLHFRVADTCDSWYFTNTAQFTDAFTESIASSINEACGDCGFSASNLGNIIPFCSGNRITYQAKIREWYSMDQSLLQILSIIQRRFNTSAAIIVPTSTFEEGSIDVSHLSLSPTSVSVQILSEIGSGDGDVSSGGSAIATMDNFDIVGSTTTTTEDGISAQEQTRPLLAVIVTAVAMVMGTFHFGL